MLVRSLVLSLAALQVAQAFPNPGRPQYGSLGEHGGIATEVSTPSAVVLPRDPGGIPHISYR